MNDVTPFSAAVAMVLAVLPDETAEELRLSTDDDFLFMTFGLGLWIRNELGVWSGNEALLAYMGARGVSHPDDISGMVLRGAKAELNGREVEMAFDEPRG